MVLQDRHNLWVFQQQKAQRREEANLTKHRSLWHSAAAGAAIRRPVLKGILAAEIQCMFWCMFASDVTAIYCDILQNRNGAQVF
jgi:hypothetical protein